MAAREGADYVPQVGTTLDSTTYRVGPPLSECGG